MLAKRLARVLEDAGIICDVGSKYKNIHEAYELKDLKQDMERLQIHFNALIRYLNVDTVDVINRDMMGGKYFGIEYKKRKGK